MKVVICQGEAIGGRPSREELIRYWKEQLKEIPEVDEVVFHNGFNKPRISKQHKCTRRCDEQNGNAQYVSDFFQVHIKIPPFSLVWNGKTKIGNRGFGIGGNMHSGRISDL